MNIIVRGNKPIEKEKYKKCKICKTEFTYIDKDITQIGMDYHELFNVVICPVCGQYICTSIFDKKVK